MLGTNAKDELAEAPVKLRRSPAFSEEIEDALHSGRRIPFEVFIDSKNMEHYPWTLALTRMISVVFCRGGDVRFVAEELHAVFDPTAVPG